MTNDRKTVRATLFIGGTGALVWLMVAPAVDGYGRWPWSLFAMVCLLLGLYAVVLSRWRGRRPVAVIFPLVVLGLLGPLMPRSSMAFGLVLVVFSWIRSGVCFPGTVARSVRRELVLCGGAGAVVALWGPSTPLTWALGIWLFSLVQALFFILCVPEPLSAAGRPGDAFDHAAHRIEDLLDGL
jgi:hypothetical protein